MMVCPRCNVDDNYVPKSWEVRFKDKEIRLRNRVCRACGVTFRTYEFSFNENITTEKITKTLDEAISFFPPVIKPYRWNQTELFPKK